MSAKEVKQSVKVIYKPLLVAHIEAANYPIKPILNQ